MALYLAGFADELAKAGAAFIAIPAITPHICLAELKPLLKLPLVDILGVKAERLRARKLKRIALFGTRFTIEAKMFGTLDGFDVVTPARRRSPTSIAHIWSSASKAQLRPGMSRSFATSPTPSAASNRSRPSSGPAPTSI